MRLPERVFFTIKEIAQRWQVSMPVIWQWAMEGDLRAHFWIPLISVYQRSSDGAPQLRHWEGYAPLSRHQCRRIFRKKEIRLREFISDAETDRCFIPETAEDLVVEIFEVSVLLSEARRFEREHQLMPAGSNSRAVVHEVSGNQFKSVHFEGADYLFGEMQSAVLKTLFESFEKGEPWQSGKQILGEIGSQSFSLGNLFKRQPIWRKLVQSDRRGFYRLSEAFIATLH